MLWSNSMQKHIMKMANQGEHVRNRVPEDLKFSSDVISISFHPTKDIIASALIDGHATVHSYNCDEGTNQLLLTVSHQKACRGVQFHEEGHLLFSISKDKTLQAVDINTEKRVHHIPKAHKSPIYSLLVIDNYLTATGDDDGVLKIWDYRRKTAIMEEKQMEEYISCLQMNADKKILLATSGEGTLTAFNIRAKKMELQSELFDSELLSIALIKNEHKVAVGSGEGVINIFNWGEWGNISDRFPGHPSSVDCLVAVTDDIVCTGCMDGKIRAVNLLPNRFIGIVGEHPESTVDNLSLSNDGKLLASCSSDESVKFWDIEYLLEQKVSDRKKAKSSNKSKHLVSSKSGTDFFADLT